MCVYLINSNPSYSRRIHPNQCNDIFPLLLRRALVFLIFVRIDFDAELHTLVLGIDFDDFPALIFFLK
jgi:hypothetical protein